MNPFLFSHVIHQLYTWNKEKDSLLFNHSLPTTYSFEIIPGGNVLIGKINSYICYVDYIEEHKKEIALNCLRTKWPEFHFVYAELPKDFFLTSLSFLVKGTPFQYAVWQETLKIPQSHTSSYGEIAKRLGMPTASRAVARAIASNHISYFIPCHRVILASGKLCGYRWEIERKRKLLSQEKELLKT